MVRLSEEHLHHLGNDALAIPIVSLQEQMTSLQTQLDSANVNLADNNRQNELLTE